MSIFIHLSPRKGGKRMAEHWTCIECGDKFNKFQGEMDERTCMTCVLKKEDPDVIRPSMLTEERKAK